MVKNRKGKGSLKVEDFKETEPWRIFRIMSEFTYAIEVLAEYRPTAVIFGSARTKPQDKYYQAAEQLGALLAKNKYTTVTGGGPGIMEAANKGATQAGGDSIGLNIALPMEQKPNPFIKTLINFHYFFIRKVMFMRYALAFVIFPGGYGTFDEMFEALTLIQTKRSDRIPVILVGKDFWKEIVDFIKFKMTSQGFIDKADVKYFTVVDTPQEVLSVINKFYRKGKKKNR